MANNNFDIDTLENSDVYDSEGAKVGTVGQVYLNDQTDQPEFVTVNIGLFGTKETFIPFDAANFSREGLRVPYTKSFIKDAPNIDVDGHLSAEEQQRLFDYYKSDRGTGTDGTRTGTGTDGTRTGTGTDGTRTGTGTDGTRTGTGTDGTGTDETEGMVAHEERLNVGTEQRQRGEVHLRKRVRTEHQNVEVPVQREELVVEREKVDPDTPGARPGGTIDENAQDEEVVTLREERPVVDKETVATEKVNIGKRTVQETETVSGDVRKEEIDIDDDSRPGKDR